MSGYRAVGPDTIVLPFIFVPDGQPIPDIARHFREPIVLRARFEPEPPRQDDSLPGPLAGSARQGVTTLPGSVAPIPVRVAAADAPDADGHGDDVVDPDEFPFLILSATGAVLAEGSRGVVGTGAASRAGHAEEPSGVSCLRRRRAGWRMDAEENLMVLPRNRAAQAKLAAAGIKRPVHDNGHLEWNEEVDAALAEIEDGLRRVGLPE